MAQVAALITALKTALKSAGITYAQIAASMDLSESSIKRKFSREEFTLSELDHICGLCGMEISALVKLMDNRNPRLQALTEQQEREIASDLSLMLVTVCVLNRWSFDNILDYYIFEKHELVQLLARLDRLKLIELQANNRIKLLVAPNFGWLPNGPIQRMFLQVIQHDLFSAKFSQEDHELIVLNGMLCRASNADFRRKLERLAREFEQLNQEDAAQPFEDRRGYTVVMAVRDWRYSGFADLRKPGVPHL